MVPSSFLIGIDLGTTNSAVAYVDTRDPRGRVELFRVPQLTAPGSLESRRILPSFLYFPEPDEIANGAAALPWNQRPAAIVGVFARDRGALAPGRQVSSAKSWLAHGAVDRRAAFLPWGATGDSPHISPVAASAQYLMHMRDAWNATVASDDEALRFEHQTIVLTVPSSFDEEARELTVEAAKERMLSDAAPEQIPITVLGAGRSVVGESIRVELTKMEVQSTLDQFLPIVESDTTGAPRDRRLGLRELGLPFEADPAITRHLAAFLARSALVLPSDHRAVLSHGGQRLVRPDLVLFNGGFFTPAVARERVAEALAHWCGAVPRLLIAGNLEAAVALGAAVYARLRAGIGSAGALVKAGSGRAYYVALRGAHEPDVITAVCVLARGTDEGTAQTFDHPFTIMTNRPVAFSVYSSTIRSDRGGDLVSLASADVQDHTPLVTVFRYGKKSRHVELPVQLSVRFTELGTLELSCISTSSEHRWRLQFQVRGVVDSVADTGAPEPDEQSADTVIIEDAAMAAGEMLVRSVFASAGAPAAHPVASGQPGAAATTPENLVAGLEQQFGYAKSAWPLGAIRRLADAVIDVAEGRRRSAAHEARWLNLFGFCVRPGFGAARDTWRIGKGREIYSAGLIFEKSGENRAEWLVLWQRVAGGLGTGQQRELAQNVMGELGMGSRKPPRVKPQIERESWRLLASLERLDAATRVKLGDEVLGRLTRDDDNASLLWSIGRLGARTPIYGPLTSVVSASDAAGWLDQLTAVKRWTPELAAAIVQIGAVTADALRDVADEILEAARERLRAAGIEADASRALYDVVRPTLADTSRAFGEPLPNGLRLRDVHAAAERG